MDNITSSSSYKSSSMADEPQESNYKPYGYNDFINDAIEFQKSYIPRS